MTGLLSSTMQVSTVSVLPVENTVFTMSSVGVLVISVDILGNGHSVKEFIYIIL